MVNLAEQSNQAVELIFVYTIQISNVRAHNIPVQCSDFLCKCKFHNTMLDIFPLTQAI